MCSSCGNPKCGKILNNSVLQNELFNKCSILKCSFKKKMTAIYPAKQNPLTCKKSVFTRDIFTYFLSSYSRTYTYLLTYQNLPTKHMKKDVLSFLFWTTILSGLAYLTASSMAQQYRICLQCKRHGFDPWVRKIPWRRKWQPTPVFLSEKSHGQRSLAGYSPQDGKESYRT